MCSDMKESKSVIYLKNILKYEFAIFYHHYYTIFFYHTLDYFFFCFSTIIYKERREIEKLTGNFEKMVYLTQPFIFVGTFIFDLNCYGPIYSKCGKRGRDRGFNNEFSEGTM